MPRLFPGVAFKGKTTMAMPGRFLELSEMAQRFGRGAADPERRVLDLAEVGLLPPSKPNLSPPRWDSRLVERWQRARTEIERLLLRGFYRGERRGIGMGRERAVARIEPGRADREAETADIEQRFAPDSSRWEPIEKRDIGQGATAGPRIEGSAIVYYDAARPGTAYRWRIENWSVEERILPTALRETNMDDVCALFNHDANYLLGRTTAGTLRLSKTPQGLDYDISLAGNVMAAGVLDAVRRRDVCGSSFAFTVFEDRWTEDQKRKTATREILAIGAVYDVGPVVYPAYKATSANVRSKRDRMTKSEIQQELVQILSTW